MPAPRSKRPGRPVGHDRRVITLSLARRLRLAGLPWEPRAGDRFVVLVRGMEQDVFHLADMTVEVHDFPTGRVVGFNGTTEWALDSVTIEETVWLPREDQLRDLLGPAFVTLERDSQGYAVRFRTADGVAVARDGDAECAYARAVLRTLEAGAVTAPARPGRPGSPRSSG